MPQDTVHRLRIELRGIRPKIWRRIEVPSAYTFWDLHSAIQDAMGWYDSHLHEFRVGPRRETIIGTEEDEANDGLGGGGRLGGLSNPLLEHLRKHFGLEAAAAEEMLSENRRLLEWETPIADHLAKKGDRAVYAYDFGDDWIHDVSVVAITPRAAGTAYPRCVDGRRACPPEDCGGPWRYADFLAALADPNHEEHEEQRSWVGAHFDPERFNKAVYFQDPQERLKAWREHGRL